MAEEFGAEAPDKEHLSVLEEQKKILDESGNSAIPSINTLKLITEKSLCVTRDTIGDFRNDSHRALVRLDLFDSVNLPTLLETALSNLLSGAVANNIKPVAERIQKNKKLKKCLEEAKGSFEKLKNFKCLSFDDKDFSDQWQLALKTINTTRDIVEKDSSLNKDEAFVVFMDNIKRFLNLCWVRYTTRSLFSQVRTKLEKIQGKVQSHSAELSVSVPLPFATGLSADTTAYHSSSSQGFAPNSFFTIGEASGGEVGISFSLPGLLKISAKGGIEKTAQELHYSLESLIDSYNFGNLSEIQKRGMSCLEDKTPDGKNAMEERKSMQDAEAEALANMIRFEAYLVMTKSLDTNVVLKWVDITRSKSMDRTSGIAGKVEVDANLTVPAVEVDVKTKASHESRTYIKDNPLLSMIDSNCSLINGLDEKKFIEIIGQHFDKHLKNSIEEQKKEIKEKGIKTEQSSEYLLFQQLIGDLQNYNNRLCNQVTASAEFTGTKSKEEEAAHRKKVDRFWVPKDFRGKPGEEGAFLKSFLLAAVKVMKKYSGPEHNTMRKKIYEYLCRLNKFCELKKSGTSELNAEAKINTLNGTIALTLPALGKTNVDFTARTMKGSPIKEDNGTYFILKFGLPLATVGIIGMKALKYLLCGAVDKLSQKKVMVEDTAKAVKGFCSNVSDITKGLDANVKKYAAVDVIGLATGIGKRIAMATNLGGAGATLTGTAATNASTVTSVTGNAAASTVGTTAENIGKTVGVEFEIEGRSEFQFQWKRLEPSADYKKIIPLPLPRRKVIEIEKVKESLWNMDYFAIQSSMNLNAGLKVPLAGLAGAFSIGDVVKAIGSNSIHYMVSKYNVLSLGTCDSGCEESTAIEGLFAEQSALLFKLFRNIAEENSKAAFELQTLYNEVLDNLETQGDKKTEWTNLMKEFLEACKELSKEKVDEESTVNAVNRSNAAAAFGGAGAGHGANAAVVSNGSVSGFGGLKAEFSSDGKKKVPDPDETANMNDVISIISGRQVVSKSEQFEQARDIFKQILKMNFDYNFRPYYDKAFVPKTK
ncbi:hypothetical protein FACS1894122_08810 [Alphaproteobacteria bacterium]|nr:hypothetical protein FACS1894122_08810 [Alphaproteobacteria bacterium]